MERRELLKLGLFAPLLKLLPIRLDEVPTIPEKADPIQLNPNWIKDLALQAEEGLMGMTMFVDYADFMD